MPNTENKPQPANKPQVVEPANTQDELSRLRAENERLKSELAQFKPEAKNHEPEWLSEGVRADLELHGETTDPYTGKRITAAEKGVQTSEEQRKEANRK